MSFSDNSNFKETLKQQADIVRIVGEYVKLKKAGVQNFSGLCPFHNEKTASFSVHATRQFYHCFGCGASGDVFSFVQKIENISFPEAVRLIAQKAGVPLPKVSFSSPTEARDAQLRTALLDVHARASDFFQQCLLRPEGASAREYLKQRGLKDETIAAFRIGYAPDSGFLLRDALRRDFDEQLLRESGLFSWKEASGSEPRADSEGPKPEARVAPLAAMYSKFRNRVMFPISNDHGKVIAFTGRTLSTDEKAGPKYLNSPETPIYSKSRVLFNLDQAREAIRELKYAILVEGQMDCISLYAAGFHNVIASSGTAFTELQAKLLGRFAKQIVVNFDPDTAGARATERTLGILVEEEFEIKVLALETGYDPDLFIRRKGKEAYADALKHSQKYFDYLIDRARALFPGRNADSKVKAVNHLLPHVQRVPSRIVRDELALEISQKLGIDSTVLRRELKHVATERSATVVKAAAESQITSAERILIRALASATEMQASGVRRSGREGAGNEDEFDPARQARYALEAENLYEGLATQSLMEALLAREAVEIMELPTSDDDRRTLASILMQDEDALTPETVEGALRALRRIGLNRRVGAAQRAVERPGLSKEERNALLEEKVRLKLAKRDPGADDAAGRAN
jgi:DNA primase